MQIKYLFVVEIDKTDSNIAYPVLDYSNSKWHGLFEGKHTVKTRRDFNKKLQDIIYSSTLNSEFAIDGSYHNEEYIGNKKIKDILFKIFGYNIEIIKHVNIPHEISRVWFKLKPNTQVLIDQIK